MEMWVGDGVVNYCQLSLVLLSSKWTATSPVVAVVVLSHAAVIRLPLSGLAWEWSSTRCRNWKNSKWDKCHGVSYFDCSLSPSPSVYSPPTEIIIALLHVTRIVGDLSALPPEGTGCLWVGLTVCLMSPVHCCAPKGGARGGSECFSFCQRENNTLGPSLVWGDTLDMKMPTP